MCRVMHKARDPRFQARFPLLELITPPIIAVVYGSSVLHSETSLDILMYA